MKEENQLNNMLHCRSRYRASPFHLLFSLRLLFVIAVLLIQPVHQIDIDKNENDENVDGALLRKPESKFEAAQAEIIQCIGEENAGPVGNQKPNDEQDGQVLQVFLPVTLGGGTFVLFHKPNVMMDFLAKDRKDVHLPHGDVNS